MIEGGEDVSESGLGLRHWPLDVGPFLTRVLILEFRGGCGTISRRIGRRAVGTSTQAAAVGFGSGCWVVRVGSGCELDAGAGGSAVPFDARLPASVAVLESDFDLVAVFLRKQSVVLCVEGWEARVGRELDGMRNGAEEGSGRVRAPKTRFCSADRDVQKCS